MKPNINSVEVHPQLSNNRHPVDGALVGVLVHRGHMYVDLNTAQQLVESPKVIGEEEHSWSKTWVWISIFFSILCWWSSGFHP